MSTYRDHDFQNWYATCQRKRKFVAWLEAYNYGQKEKIIRGREFKVYECPYCKNYHLTCQLNEDKKVQSPRRIG